MRISDWSSDVCSSDLSMLMGVQAFLVHCAVGGLAEQPCDMHRLATRALADLVAAGGAVGNDDRLGTGRAHPRQQAELAHAPRYLRRIQIGRASCRERVCQYV